MHVLEDGDLLDIRFAVRHDNPAQVYRSDRLVTSIEGDQPFRRVVTKLREGRGEPLLPVREVAVHLFERLEHGLDCVVVRAHPSGVLESGERLVPRGHVARPRRRRIERIRAGPHDTPDPRIGWIEQSPPHEEMTLQRCMRLPQRDISDPVPPNFPPPVTAVTKRPSTAREILETTARDRASLTWGALSRSDMVCVRPVNRTRR